MLFCVFLVQAEGSKTNPLVVKARHVVHTMRNSSTLQELLREVQKDLLLDSEPAQEEAKQEEEDEEEKETFIHEKFMPVDNKTWSRVLKLIKDVVTRCVHVPLCPTLLLSYRFGLSICCIAQLEFNFLHDSPTARASRSCCEGCVQERVQGRC